LRLVSELDRAVPDAPVDALADKCGLIPGPIWPPQGEEVRRASDYGDLCQEAAARHIDAGPLVFGGSLPVADYLARYTVADLFLDTLP